MVDTISAVFDFIYSLLSTIVEGVNGIYTIITNIFQIIFNLIKVFPTPIYMIFYSYITIFLAICIFKLFRKG